MAEILNPRSSVLSEGAFLRRGPLLQKTAMGLSLPGLTFGLGILGFRGLGV